MKPQYSNTGVSCNTKNLVLQTRGFQTKSNCVLMEYNGKYTFGIKNKVFVAAISTPLTGEDVALFWFSC